MIYDRRFYGADAHFLDRRYADVIRLLRPLRREVNAKTPPDELGEHSELLWEIEDRLIRALVRTGGKAMDEALVLADEVAKRDNDYDYLAIVHANRGDVPATLAALEQAIEDRDDAERLFDDDDLARILKGDAYKAARKKFLPD